MVTHQALLAFSAIWGVGPVSAHRLAERFNSIAHLRKHLAAHPQDKVLTRNQYLGLKYYEDLKVRIPR